MRVIQFSGYLPYQFNLQESPPDVIRSWGRGHNRLSYQSTQSPNVTYSLTSSSLFNWVPGWQNFWQTLPRAWSQLKNSLPTFLGSSPSRPIINQPNQPEIDPGWTFFPQLPDVPEEREVSQSPQKKADFPSLGSKSIPIKGAYKKEAELILQDGNLGLPAYRYGNLNHHGAFWLEDIHGNTLGLLSRQRTKQTFGDLAPRGFYRISLELPHPDLPEPLQQSIQHRLLGEAVKQAKANYIRLVAEPENREEEQLFRQHGFVNLQNSLNRYVPEGQNNQSSKHTGDLLAFDGFLDGYGANFFRRNAVNSAIQRN